MPSYRPSSSPTPLPSTGEPSGVPFGVSLLAFLAGVVFLMLSGKSVWQDVQLANRLTHLEKFYEPVPAKWLKVAIRRDASGSDEFYPDILFDANVRGTSVWGWQLSLEETPADSAYWVERLKRYRVGDTVTAYVSPVDPKDSFIERKTGGIQRILSKMMLGLAFGLFGGTLVVLSLVGWVRKTGTRRKK
jgi:hypothetical protein